jgi:hypothetical protein
MISQLIIFIFSSHLSIHFAKLFDLLIFNFIIPNHDYHFQMILFYPSNFSFLLLIFLYLFLNPLLPQELVLIIYYFDHLIFICIFIYKILFFHYY